MNSRPDIRVYKRRLRERYKSIRQNMDEEQKQDADRRILQRITGLSEYSKCKTLLVFVSTGIEVDTHKLINRALKDGKAVAVPYCIDGTRKMHFYEIKSLSDLRPRTFGVLEPDPETSKRVTDFQNSICILPGLSFDADGFRLGYGGGYYDRFLSKVYRKSGLKVGICYSNCTSHHLPRGFFDVPCDLLITEKYIRPTDKSVMKYRGRSRTK